MNKRSTRLTAKQLAKLAAEFDGPREPKFLTPPAEEKRRHDDLVRAIKRRRGRPRTGAGARRVQITVERSLLAEADRYAKRQGWSRSELIAHCLTPVVRKKSA
jgi:hypothetical protein